jgi:hypothetical protein
MSMQAVPAHVSVQMVQPVLCTARLCFISGVDGIGAAAQCFGERIPSMKEQPLWPKNRPI